MSTSTEYNAKLYLQAHDAIPAILAAAAEIDFTVGPDAKCYDLVGGPIADALTKAGADCCLLDQLGLSVMMLAELARRYTDLRSRIEAHPSGDPSAATCVCTGSGYPHVPSSARCTPPPAEPDVRPDPNHACAAHDDAHLGQICPDILAAEWERVDPEGVAELRRSAARLQGAPDSAPKPHEPLCVDKIGHPHDNECECWCHDEDGPDHSLAEARQRGPNYRECPHCPGAAMSDAALDEHIKRVHPDTGSNPGGGS